jgi:murein DD-endopeptidase MepM/ murein hydrolase activator NlpD
MRHHLVGILGLALCLIGLQGLLVERSEAVRAPPPTQSSNPVPPIPIPVDPDDALRPDARPEGPPVVDEAPPTAALDPPVAEQDPPPQVERPPLDWSTVHVQEGDNLARIFDHLGLPRVELQSVIALAQPRSLLRFIHPGDTMRIAVGPEGRCQRLEYPIDSLRNLTVWREGERLRSRIETLDHQRQLRFATGTVDRALYTGARAAGLPDRQIMDLVQIFGWDIDFALDIRRGDRFSVIYEAFYRGDERIATGAILAAEFVNRGKRIRALRFSADARSGYYTPEGVPLRKAFLRTPVKYARISSGFAQRRWHPLLHRFRAHKGVDYAAPAGTPVRATGDGKVGFVGRKGGYGKVAILNHGARYRTLYAHLARFARGLRSGSRVEQGQIIGYIGQTGLATGPHLHYEFRIDGVHRDPLRVELPAAPTLPAAQLAEFRAQTQVYLTQLDSLGGTRLAVAPRD